MHNHQEIKHTLKDTYTLDTVTLDTMTKIDPTINNHNINNAHYLYWLGGFFEGEGSASISIVANKSFKYGIQLQPVFNITQHVNGIKILASFKELYKAGSLVEKSGSPHVWVYTLKGYKNMIEHVIPFMEKYVIPFSCKTKEYFIFKEICIMSDLKMQTNKASLIKMVELVYTYEGKGKYRKRKLSEILDIINLNDNDYSPSPFSLYFVVLMVFEILRDYTLNNTLCEIVY